MFIWPSGNKVICREIFSVVIFGQNTSKEKVEADVKNVGPYFCVVINLSICTILLKVYGFFKKKINN